MGWAETLLKLGSGAVGQVASRLVTDENAAARLAALASAAQRSRQAFDQWQRQLLSTLGVASGADLRDTAKRVAQLRKTARQLDRKLAQLDEKKTPPR